MTHPSGVAVVWDDRFVDYDFGEGHPFRERYRALGVELLESLRLLGPKAPVGPRIARVEPATTEELETFHTPRYLSRVKDQGAQDDPGFLDRGDTPAFPGCFEATARIVGGTLAAVRRVLGGESDHAVSFSGGLHHAAPGHASGFCIFNDIGIAIHEVLKEGGRVAYVDIDAHHGDGVMYRFYNDGRVLDIDFHQDGRTLFPGTGTVQETGADDGQGLKVNVPLPPGAGDEALVPLFDQVVPPMIRDFHPDLLLLQGGADAHAGDPLAHLQYTLAGYRHVVSSLHALSHELTGGRFVILGGGGYHPANVSRVLAQHAMILADHPLPEPGEELPPAWRTRFAEVAGRPAPRTWGELTPRVQSPWNATRQENLLAAISQAIGRRF